MVFESIVSVPFRSVTKKNLLSGFFILHVTVPSETLYVSVFVINTLLDSATVTDRLPAGFKIDIFSSDSPLNVTSDMLEVLVFNDEICGNVYVIKYIGFIPFL